MTEQSAADCGKYRESKEIDMFEFGNKKKNKILIWVVVIVLVLAMVVPTAYALLEAIFA